MKKSCTSKSVSRRGAIEGVVRAGQNSAAMTVTPVVRKLSDRQSKCGRADCASHVPSAGGVRRYDVLGGSEIKKEMKRQVTFYPCCQTPSCM